MPVIESVWEVESSRNVTRFINRRAKENPIWKSITLDRDKNEVAVRFYPQFKGPGVVMTLNLLYKPEGDLNHAMFVISRWDGHDIRTFSVSARPRDNAVRWTALTTDDIHNPTSAMQPMGVPWEYNGLGYNLSSPPTARDLFAFEVERLSTPDYQSNFPEMVEIADIMKLTFPQKLNPDRFFQTPPGAQHSEIMEQLLPLNFESYPPL